MALIVFLRGVNVGGHRRVRPSAIARELSKHDVVNVGAAGTFVVRKPGPRAKFLSALRQLLPFETEIVSCDSRDLTRLVDAKPFDGEVSRPDLVRFVSILAKPGRDRPVAPIAIPPRGEWFVRVTGTTDRFIVGVYRRHMKTITHLRQLDTLFGAPATTRSWSTIGAILRVLRDRRPSA